MSRGGNVMERRPVRSVVVWGLAISLLLVTALVYPQTVPHAAHHAHHNASTHASVLCAWLCAAGQALVGISPLIQTDLGLLRAPVLVVPVGPSTLIHLTLTSRGPPGARI